MGVWILLCVTSSTAQHLSTARTVAIGAATATAGDLSSLDWNPAGLSRMSDWEFSSTSYAPLAGNDRSVTFQMIGLGRRMNPALSAAFRYSPGRRIDFVVPTTFTFNDSSTTFVTQFDKKVGYEELVSFGAAWTPGPAWSVGASVHYMEEQVTDTRYAIDTSSFIRASTVDLAGSIWTIDLGLLWKPEDAWRVGASVTNLVRGIGAKLPPDQSAFELAIPRTLRGGAAYTGWRGLTLAADADTRKQFHAGGEYRVRPTFALRAGAYASADSALSLDALSFGAGTSFGALRVDVSYLAFLDQGNRRGSADISVFTESDLNGIDYNAFTSDRLSLTATLNVGSRSESTVRIEAVDLSGDLYPACRALYAYMPVGTARVRNNGKRPVDAKVSLWIDGYMDLPTESQSYRVEPGDTTTIPFSAVLNSRAASNRTVDITEAELTVHATPSDGEDDRAISTVLVRGRNDWNGDAATLKYFVTPGDPEVMRFSRAALAPHKTLLDTLPGMFLGVAKARIVFDALAKGLQYVGDPAQSADNVQYPSETLSLKAGDCDDLSVCYAALLGSMGIATAFIDVVPPDHPEKSHVYLMFDSGIDPPHATRLSDNPKRYVVRKNALGVESLWLPVETTAMTGGFEKAWITGADTWLHETEVDLGLVKGWLRVIDVETVN
jgi:hypothetical protein